jgi:hypothetical protein
MSRRKKKHKGGDGTIELNMAAMLDMAFQLLAFFILTFKPSDVEIQISMLMPPMKQVAQGSSSVAPTEPPPEIDENLGFPLPIVVYSKPDSTIDRISVGSNAIESPDIQALLASFEAKVRDSVGSAGFESIDLKVQAALGYENLIRIIDICTRQKLPTGEPVTKLSVSQIP